MLLGQDAPSLSLVDLPRASSLLSCFTEVTLYITDVWRSHYILLENNLQRWLQKHEAKVNDIRLLDLRINMMNNAYLSSSIVIRNEEKGYSAVEEKDLLIRNNF
jgi:hypothetical protein